MNPIGSGLYVGNQLNQLESGPSSQSRDKPVAPQSAAPTTQSAPPINPPTQRVDETEATSDSDNNSHRLGGNVNTYA